MARKNKDHRRVSSKGQAGIERAEILSLGGQQAVIWRSGGVKASRTTDHKKEEGRRACRERVRL